MASSLVKGLWLSLIVGAVLATVDSTITADDDLKFTASQQKGFNEVISQAIPLTKFFFTSLLWNFNSSSKSE